MNSTLFYAVMVLAFLPVLTGCKSTKAPPPSEPGLARGVRNNCYSLLHQLLSQQKNIGLLRFIKREEDDVKLLLKDIAAQSAAGAKQLKEFADQDSSVNLEDIWLPAGEAATREAIAATTKEALLHESGDEFELNLLLTQAKALSYAWHLAKVGGENDPDVSRAQALNQIAKEMERLNDKVFLMLLSRMK